MIKRFIEVSDLAGLAGFEPTGCRSQSPVPYRLATANIQVRYRKKAFK